MKARRLKNLRIRRVDLVERGANQAADVVLFKAKDMAEKPEDDPQPEPELGEDEVLCKGCGHKATKGDKYCAACGEAMTDETETKPAAKAAKERHMAENTELIKKLQGDLDAATKLAEEEASKREAVEKSIREQAETIAQLKKQADEQAAEIAKAKDAAKLAEFKKTVDAFEHLPVKADVFAPVLKKCFEALDEAGQTELMRVLKAADAAGADNFIEHGAPGNDTKQTGAQAEFDAKVEELVAKGTSKVDALTRVAKENPKLYARVRKESYSAPRAEKEEE